MDQRSSSCLAAGFVWRVVAQLVGDDIIGEVRDL
jgi:hypothetical protein